MFTADWVALVGNQCSREYTANRLNLVYVTASHDFLVNQRMNKQKTWIDKLPFWSPNMQHHQFFCNHFSTTASAFLRRLLQGELPQMGSRSMSHVVSAGGLKDSRLSQDQTRLKPGAPEQNKCCVMEREDGYLPLINMLLETKHRRCHSVFHNFDGVCILMCCFLFTANSLVSPRAF